MAGTTAFDVKDALLDKLQTDSAFSTLDDDAIWYGYRGRTDLTPNQIIWVGEIEWEDETGVALGALRRDEYYRIVVTIECHVSGHTQKEANYCAKGWMQKIEHIVGDPRWASPYLANVGQTATVECELKPQMLGEGQDSIGSFGAILVMVLRVHARKTP